MEETQNIKRSISVVKHSRLSHSFFFCGPMTNRHCIQTTFLEKDFFLQICIEINFTLVVGGALCLEANFFHMSELRLQHHSASRMLPTAGFEREPLKCCIIDLWLKGAARSECFFAQRVHSTVRGDWRAPQRELTSSCEFTSRGRCCCELWNHRKFALQFTAKQFMTGLVIKSSCQHVFFFEHANSREIGAIIASV